MGDRERTEPAAPDPVVAAARRALAEAAAATAILLDRDAWPASAAPHLLEGWRAVLEATGHVDAERPLGEQLRHRRLAGLVEAEQREVATVLDRLVDAWPSVEALPEGVTRPALRWQARLLSAEARRLLREQGVRRSPWLWVGVGATVMAAVAIAVMSTGGPDAAGAARGQGWLGRYYPELDFAGEPEVRYDEAIDFEWLDEPPMDDVPKDRYTVRWDTCLELEAADTLQFRLGSDDGSRLLIDGERVIDNWQDQAGNWKDHTAELEAGVHHLRVEYYENGGDALAILNVTGPAGPLPPTSLHPPRLRNGDVVCQQ